MEPGLYYLCIIWWLGGQDSNLDPEVQSLLAYHLAYPPTMRAPVTAGVRLSGEWYQHSL